MTEQSYAAVTEVVDRRGQRNDVSQLARGGAINLVGAASFGVLNFVLLIVLTRGLGAGTAGAFLEAVAIFNIVATTATVGVDTGLVRTVSRHRALARGPDLRTTLIVGLVPVAIVGVAMAYATWVFSDQLATIVGDPAHHAEIATYVRVLAAFLPVAALHFAVLGATRGYSTMNPTVFIDRIGRPFLQPLLCLAVIALGLGSRLLALAWAGPFLLGLFAGAEALRRLRHTSDGFEDPTPQLRSALLRHAREFWRFTLPRTFASVFRVVVQWLDVLLVGGLLSTRHAAIYAVSTRLLQFGFIVAHSVSQVIQPMVSGLLSADERGRAQGLFGIATAWLVALTWPQYLALAIFAPALLAIFGPQFVDGATVVLILALSGLVGSAAGPVDMVLLMAGKSTWSMWNTGAVLGANVGLNFLLIPQMGIRGAAFAWAISRILGNALPLVQVRHHLGMHPMGPGLLYAGGLSLACFGAFGFFVRGVVGPTLGAFALYAIASCLVYAGCLWWFRSQLQLVEGWAAIKRRHGASAEAAA